MNRSAGFLVPSQEAEQNGKENSGKRRAEDAGLDDADKAAGHPKSKCLGERLTSNNSNHDENEDNTV